MAIKKYRRIATSLSILAMTMVFAASSAHADPWRKIDEGLYFIRTPQVQAFKMDPEKFKLQVLEGKISFKESSATVQQLAQRFKPVVVVNGGFFSPEGKSLGLLMNNGTRLNGFHKTPWWSVFHVSARKPGIHSAKDFNAKHSTEMAIQAGPRLLIRGHIPKLKFSLARRSGIGFQPDGHVVIAVADQAELSLTAFADLFRKPESEGGLGCTDALNLDGGGSTQMAARWKDLAVDIRGDTKIPNAIAVFPRALPVKKVGR